MKKLLLLCFVFFTGFSHAQDVIVKKDGNTILAKVLEVNQVDIKYKKFSNLQGPIYTINKTEIMVINYESGDKDAFEDNHNSATARLVNKAADSRNKEIIHRYNQLYSPTKNVGTKNTPASYCFLIYGVSSSSLMSNEEVEVSIEKNVSQDIPFKYDLAYRYYTICIKNKTDRPIYIDKGNCFRVDNTGGSLCYFDISEQTSVTQGSGSGASVGLGGIAGALGVGGVVGSMAGGVAIGGGRSFSSSTTYIEQRVITVPPHGTKNLTEEKWVQTKNGGFFSPDSWKRIEKAETFYFTLKGNDNKQYWWGPSEYIPSSFFGLKKKSINCGEVITYNEMTSPWTRTYSLCYSTDEYFSSYSILSFKLYVHEIIGSQTSGIKENKCGDKKIEKYIERTDNNMIVGYHKLNDD